MKLGEDNHFVVCSIKNPFSDRKREEFRPLLAYLEGTTIRKRNKEDAPPDSSPKSDQRKEDATDDGTDES